MEVETHATPPVESPEQRYASIHRAIERGLESDELWKDLALVSAELGHNEEALRCLGKIVNPHVLKTEKEGDMVCYTMQAKQGIAKGTYRMCWKDKKIRTVKQVSLDF